jgi:hypothetical protein
LRSIVGCLGSLSGLSESTHDASMGQSSPKINNVVLDVRVIITPLSVKNYHLKKTPSSVSKHNPRRLSASRLG